MSLQKITFKELFKLDSQKFEEYNNVLRHVVAIPLNKNIKSITDLTFGEVATIKLCLNDSTFENIIDVFKIIFKLKRKELLKINVVEFYKSLNWIKDEIKNIYSKEIDNLTSVTDSKLKDAGIEDLNIFGEMNTLIMLGEKFSKSPQEVESWNYDVVFSLMLHHKITNEINKRYSELNKLKNND